MDSPKKPPQKKQKRHSAKIPSLVHDAQVSSRINLAARLTQKAARIRLGEVGAWPGQIPLLLWLLEEDGMIQKDIIARTGIEQSTVAEHLERMERMGLVRRDRGPDDRRTFRIHLTAEGRSISEKLVVGLETGARIFTKGISKEDMAVFDSVMQRIIDNLNKFVDQSKSEKAESPASIEQPIAEQPAKRSRAPARAAG